MSAPSVRAVNESGLPVGVGELHQRTTVPNPCSVVRDNAHPGRGTVLVLGTPRGGTSVVAGICHMLGVPMGLDIDPSNMEDREFRQILEGDDVPFAAAKYFTRARRRHSLVGVKSPVVIDRLSEFYPTVIDPVLVVVSRDIYATAQREECSGHDFFASLREVIRRKFAILDFVEVGQAPLVIVSYERLIQDSRIAVETLARFITGSIDDHLVRHIVGLVRPHADMPREVDFVRARLDYEGSQRRTWSREMTTSPTGKRLRG